MASSIQSGSSRVRYALVALLVTRPAQAWIFSEHVEITSRALAVIEQTKDARVRDVLATARSSLRLCAEALSPTCPTLGALPALAADHSCRPGALREMLETAHRDPARRVQRVLGVAAQTYANLKAADRDASEREDIRRQMHVNLQIADEAYLATALMDGAHFQATRGAGSSADLERYLGLALAPAARANATAAYVNFHVVAVRHAARAQASRRRRDYAEWVTRAVVAEAFAAHYLEDSFSAGHFVGHWGDDATRLGTHDFYSRAGVEAASWNAPTDTFVAHGDAFLSYDEARVIADAVAASLAQVLAAATDQHSADSLLGEFASAFAEEEYDGCNRSDAPAGLTALARSTSLQSIVAREPVPAVHSPALARVRAEKGLFLGGAATAAASHEFAPGTFGTQIRAAFRAGVGAAGIIDDPLNAQAFLDAGFVGQHLIGSSITGYSFRIRAPGYLFLVDGMVALALAQYLQESCPFCLSWGASAAGGGAGRWWRSVPLFGSVSGQFSLLRDVSLNWFPDEPSPGRYRVELSMPALTARSVLPIAGERWSQSTDFYLDIGPSLTFDDQHPKGTWGVFASFAMAARMFP